MEGKVSPFHVDLIAGNALGYAASSGSPEFGKFLLEAGVYGELVVDSDRSRNSIDDFHECMLWGQFDDNGDSLVRGMFVDSGFLESRGFTILYKIILGLVTKDLAAELAISTATINPRDADASVGRCDNIFRTALHSYCKWPVAKGSVDTIDELVSAGLDVDLPNANGETPLLNILYSGYSVAA